MREILGIIKALCFLTVYPVARVNSNAMTIWIIYAEEMVSIKCFVRNVSSNNSTINQSLSIWLATSLAAFRLQRPNACFLGRIGTCGKI